MFPANIMFNVIHASEQAAREQVAVFKAALQTVVPADCVDLDYVDFPTARDPDADHVIRVHVAVGTSAQLQAVANLFNVAIRR